MINSRPKARRRKRWLLIISDKRETLFGGYLSRLAFSSASQQLTFSSGAAGQVKLQKLYPEYFQPWENRETPRPIEGR